MEFTTAEKDFGVVIDNKLTCEKVDEANSMMGVIRRTFDYLDIKTSKTLHTSLVRPHIGFANQVWNPYLKINIDILESTQLNQYRDILISHIKNVYVKLVFQHFHIGGCAVT